MLRIISIISNMFKAATAYILSLTLYGMMCSSSDFEDVKAALNDRTDWSIELFRTCFTIHLSNGSYFFMLSTLCLLFMAENIRLGYGRLSAPALKECAKRIGYATLSLLLAILDVGFVVVRITGLVALSGYPGVAALLVLLSISPLAIIPALAYIAGHFKRKQWNSAGESDSESGKTGSDAA